jgi:hypothetical protein
LKSRAAAPGELILGVAALVLFVVYFGAHCFRYPRVGDHLRHTAAVASLYRNFLHPAHEAMAVPGSLSEVHTPYIVAVAALGRGIGVTPYRALQIVGVANLVFYCWAVWFFFGAFSVVRSNWVGIVVFLFVSLFLRNRIFWWASETSFAAVRLIQSYPSFFAWGVALTCFALAERFLRRPHGARLVGIVVLVWTLVLSHNLTASWVVGILGLQALLALFGRSESRRAVPFLAAGVAIAVALAFTWPYFDISLSSGLLGIREGSEFGAHPFRDMAGLYALALPAAVFFLTRGRHALWVAGLIVTFLALEIFRALGMEYGNRYAFFQAFFAQALVAELAGLGAVVLLGREDRLAGDFRFGSRLRVAVVLFAAATLVLTGAAPIAREEGRAGRPLLTPSRLAALPPTHDLYYAQLEAVGLRLDPGDIVMMPVEHAAWNVSAITGARVVASLFAYRVPDHSTRVRDVARFFSPGADDRERAATLRRYSVTKILLTPQVLDREPAMTAFLGSSIARTQSLVLFGATPLNREAVASKRLGQSDLLADGPAMIELGHGRDVAVANESPLVNPHGPAAVLPDLREGVRDEENGLARFPEVFDALVALQLKTLVPDRERFVDEKDLRLDVGGDGEREPRRHAARIRADGRVDELLDLGPLDDPGSPAAHLGAGESEKRPLKHYVFPARQLAVKAEPELEQRRDAADDDDAPHRRRHDARDQTEEGALPGAVLPDHPQGLPRVHLQGHVAQGFELVEEEAALQAADGVLLQRADPLPRDAVPDGGAFDGDDGRHPANSGGRTARRGSKSRSNRSRRRREKSRATFQRGPETEGRRRKSASGTSG